VEYTDELPKTVGGKIKRKLIRSRDGIKDDKIHSLGSDASHAEESWHQR
jgi:acetyl-CoA synthetase